MQNATDVVTGGNWSTNRTENEIYTVHNPLQIIIDKYVTPIIYVVGFPGNIIAFFIWIGKRMRHSSGCYLAALAISDMMFLLLHVLFELMTVWNVAILDLPVVCEVYTMLYLSVQYYSPLLVLGFTIERYISICHPFLREKLCTTRRAVVVILCLYAIAFALCSIQGYFWMYDYDAKACTMREEVVAGGTASLWTIWTWITEMLIFLLVPVMVLGFNVMVIREARRLRREETLRSLSGQTRKNSATTIMLLAVSFYLIFTTLPVTIVYSIYYSFPPGYAFLNDEEISTDPTWQRHFSYVLIRVFIQEIGLTHYACNFYIYCITGKAFRAELCRMFRHLWCKGALKDKIGAYANYRSTGSTAVGRTTYVTVNGQDGQSRDSSPETLL